MVRHDATELRWLAAQNPELQARIRAIAVRMATVKETTTDEELLTSIKFARESPESFAEIMDVLEVPADSELAELRWLAVQTPALQARIRAMAVRAAAANETTTDEELPTSSRLARENPESFDHIRSVFGGVMNGEDLLGKGSGKG